MGELVSIRTVVQRTLRTIGILLGDPEPTLRYIHGIRERGSGVASCCRPLAECTHEHPPWLSVPSCYPIFSPHGSRVARLRI